VVAKEIPTRRRGLFFGLRRMLGGGLVFLVAGPVVGAIIFIAANEFFVTKLGSSELNIVAMGLLLALVLLFFPEGIVGTFKERGWLPQILDWD